MLDSLEANLEESAAHWFCEGCKTYYTNVESFHGCPEGHKYCYKCAITLEFKELDDDEFSMEKDQCPMCMNNIEQLVMLKFKDLINENSYFGITDYNDELIVFEYPMYYDNYEDHVKLIYKKWAEIKEKIIPYIKNELNYKGNIFITDIVY